MSVIISCAFSFLDWNVNEWNRLFNNRLLKVLYDDTAERAGTKLARADLIGLPFQIIIGPKALKGRVYDLKCRKSGDISRLSYDDLMNFVQTN